MKPGSVPQALASDDLPAPEIAELCTLCRGDWTAHLSVARDRWDREHADETFEPGERLPSVTVLPVDCIVVLRRAAMGPEGPVGAQGAMGLRGERGPRGSSGGSSWSEPLP